MMMQDVAMSAPTPSSEIEARLRGLSIHVPMETATPVPMMVESKREKKKAPAPPAQTVHPEIAHIESQAEFVARQIKVLQSQLVQHKERLKEILVQSGQKKLHGNKITVYEMTRADPSSQRKLKIPRLEERTDDDTAAYINRFLVLNKCIPPGVDIGNPCMAWIREQWIVDHPVTKMEEDTAPPVHLKKTLVIRGLPK